MAGAFLAALGSVAALAVRLERRCRIVRRKTDPSILDELIALGPEWEEPKKVA